MKKIAICIPTYNRAEIICDTCRKIDSVINGDIFDVFIYDSSPGTETREALSNYIQKDYFIYIRMPEHLHSSEKLFLIYQDTNIQNKYEYMWVLPDYYFVSKKVIRSILEILNEKWDMIMLDFFDPEKEGDKQYEDPNQIFLKYAWSMTLFGILIINCETVLKSMDWNSIKDKYLNEKYRNFLHVIIYFERMLQISELKFYHFSIPKGNRSISRYRKSESEYLDDFLKVWGSCWYESIHVLPEIYTNKDYVTKKACIYTGSLNKKNLAILKVRGVFTRKVYWEYKNIWKVISTANTATTYAILFLPKKFVNVIAQYGSINKWIKYIYSIKKFEKFCKAHAKLYLYGAGVKGVRMSELLEEREIPFKSFVVTDLDGEITNLKGHRIIEISQLENSPDIGIILSLNERNKKQVYNLLCEKGFENIFQLELV